MVEYIAYNDRVNGSSPLLLIFILNSFFIFSLNMTLNFLVFSICFGDAPER